MIGGGVTVSMSGNLRGLIAKERRVSLNVLRRAGAYLRGAVRRRIRETKHKTSNPGESPRSHGTFRRSIVFRVDSSRMVAIVGPGSLLRKSAGGGSAPRILEFGGTTDIGANNWFAKDAPKAQTEADVATWFRKRTSLPIYMATDRMALLNQMLREEKRNPTPRFLNRFHRSVRSRKHLVGNRRENVFFIPVRPVNATDRLFRRAARVTVAHFGMPYRKAVRIAPRPYLAPALESTRADIVKIFANSLPPALRGG